MWNPEYWALESRVQLLESRIPLKNESGILNRINGFHAYPCHHGYAKTQTADHLERGFLAGEFRLLQLANTNSFMTYHPIDFDTDVAKVPY